MEISKLSDVEFKTIVTRMLKELSEDVNSIKKKKQKTNNPVRNKDILTELKDNLQGNNSMKARIKSMILNIRKQKTTNQNDKKKRESKKTRIV